MDWTKINWGETLGAGGVGLLAIKSLVDLGRWLLTAVDATRKNRRVDQQTVIDMFEKSKAETMELFRDCERRHEETRAKAEAKEDKLTAKFDTLRSEYDRLVGRFDTIEKQQATSTTVDKVAGATLFAAMKTDPETLKQTIKDISDDHPSAG